MNLATIIDSAAAKTPDKPMVIDGDRHWTYADMVAATHRGAARLKTLGVERGDRVALMSFNTPEFVVAMFAIWRLGAIVVPVNHKLSAAECGYIFQHCRAKLVLASDTLCAVADSALSDSQVIALDGGEGSDFSPLRGAAAEVRETVSLEPIDPAQILYTSGTTGRPKGCVHTHQGVRNTAMLSALTFTMTPSERTLIAMPIWHAAPLNNFTMSTLFVGGTLVLLREYHPLAFVQTLQAQRVTSYFGAPVSFILPLSLPGGLETYDFSSVRLFAYGGGPISAEVARQLSVAYRTDRFHQVYGMTETGPAGTILYSDEQIAKAGSIGRTAQIGIDMRVVRDDGGTACAGEVGEIWLRSDSLMIGYLDDPAATADVVIDGWYKTADLARIDDDGYLTIVDRLNDMIITGGENVYSKEVEDALHATGLVADCAVIGMPHPDWGETVVAAVISHPGETVDAEGLRTALVRYLAPYKIPRRFTAVDALPRTPTGKVVKGELRLLLKV